MNGWEAFIVGLVGVGLGAWVYKIGYDRGQRSMQRGPIVGADLQRVAQGLPVQGLGSVYRFRRV